VVGAVEEEAVVAGVVVVVEEASDLAITGSKAILVEVRLERNIP
jgi:hypothetical protein